MDSVTKPLYRSLNGYALDPSFSLKTETFFANEIVYKVPWEDTPVFGVGPKGEYVEVIDKELKDDFLNTRVVEGREICPPVNLDEPAILAMDGLPIDETNFQFHQQMVYAVAMTTIKSFESGLGRPILWAQDFKEQSTKSSNKKQGRVTDRQPFVHALKMYPHANRDANAYFNNHLNAGVFGYFLSDPGNDLSYVPDTIPGSPVYTCLHHDIVAHTTVHAIIYGLYKSYTEPVNPDVFAFQEFLADTIPICQHFLFPEFLRQEITRINGDFKQRTFLFEVAILFGKAVGYRGPLRDAIGEIDKETGKWKLKEPKREDYEKVVEPHKRGELLTAAIFGAFRIIYERAISDLRRIAKHKGKLGEDPLDIDLVNRFAETANKTARHLRDICIRGLDYCPPTDLTFGDFLRAIITADHDLFEEDDRRYRKAIIEAFMERGIYPQGLSSISETSLCYESLQGDQQITDLFRDITFFLRDYRKKIITAGNRKEIHSVTNDFIHGDEKGLQKGLYERIIRDKKFRNSRTIAKLTGLCLGKGWRELGISTSNSHGIASPLFEIQSLHLASRINSEGKQTNHIVLSLLQSAKVLVDQPPGTKKVTFKPHYSTSRSKKENRKVMTFTGGCTLIFDLHSTELKYCISKPLIDAKTHNGKFQLNRERMSKVHAYKISAEGEFTH